MSTTGQSVSRIKGAQSTGLLSAVAVMLFSLPGLDLAQTSSTRIFVIDHVKLDPGERITGIDLKLTGAMFIEISSLPKGWTMQINTDSSWNTEFNGDITVGAASLEVDKLHFLRFRIEREPASSEPFGATGILHVTDWNSPERDIPITITNLQFEERTAK